MLFEHINPDDPWGTRTDIAAYKKIIKQEADATVTDAAGARMYRRMSSAMRRAQHELAKQNLILLDMPYDGSCAVWACLPFLSKLLRRPIDVEEARDELVLAMRSPLLRDDLERDLRQTNTYLASRGEPPLASTDALLGTFFEPDVYLQPILVARALEVLSSGKRFQVLGHDTTNIITVYESPGDEPFACRLFIEPVIEHVGLIVTVDDAIDMAITST